MRTDGGLMRGTRRAVVTVALTVAVGVAVASAVAAVLLGAPWLWAVTAVCAVAAVAAVAAPRRAAALDDPSRPPPEPAPAPAPGPAERDVDDLPGFFTHPPGSPPAPTAAQTPAQPPAQTTAPADSDPTAVQHDDTGAPDTAGAATRGRPARGLVVGGAAVVVLGVVVAAVVVTGRGDDDPAVAGPAPGSSASTGPATTAVRTPATAAPLTAAAAGDLADTDLPPGDDGFTAAVSFAGVVLEPRAVGVTVVYPELRISDDGSSTVAHLDLPVWNCLSPEPPADPVAAQCSRAPEEHADLGSPELEADRSGDRVALTGAVATYTRPTGSAPAYTGRSYELTVQLTTTGTGASGTLTLGGTPVGTTGPGSFSG